jgi:hypothetical protein
MAARPFGKGRAAPLVGPVAAKIANGGHGVAAQVADWHLLHASSVFEASLRDPFITCFPRFLLGWQRGASAGIIHCLRNWNNFLT